MTGPRFLIGVDLGTTNSVLAFIDLQPAGRQGATHAPQGMAPTVGRVRQVIAPGEVAALDTLPSFLYIPRAEEKGRLSIPWAAEPDLVAGAFARDQGSLQPARQVASAKSWLCHPTADRTARILPWGADDPVVSPVEASARILAHLREAWNHSFASSNDAARMEHQAVVLTVPASFDQEARELTLQAAKQAGLGELTVLEEPLAAFYAWIAGHRGELQRRFRGGEEVLVCDVGGGTTDFTAIRVRVEEGEVGFERTAVGEHLLLGGDNMDLALARRLEGRFGDRALTVVQRLALRRSVSAAKERLLSEGGPEKVQVTVLGGGRALVGGAITADLTRAEVLEVLSEGFLPIVAPGEGPQKDRRSALLEMGLPYAADPAITRHLAAFLRAAARAVGEAEPRRPDAVLFNGGFFTPVVARQRVLEALGRWFGSEEDWRPAELHNEAPSAAVALGAAHYAFVRLRGGLRVRAGSARAYYLGVATTVGGDAAATSSDRGDLAAGTHEEVLTESVRALCLLPRGAEEGTTFDLEHGELAVVTNRPASFPLFSSATRQDAPGDLVMLDPTDVHRHAPLATVLRYGRKSRHVELAVTISATYTETGTLEVSCASRTSEHSWRLRFQLRGEREDEPPAAGPEAESLVSPANLDAARAALVAVFSGSGLETATFSRLTPGSGLTPEALPSQLEAVLGFGRAAWTTPVIRALADTLLEVADGRRRGPRFEARWLNLLGFCLRPGFGAPADDWRIGRVRGIYVESLVFPNDPQCQAEWVVLWQRVAAGLKAGQQRELYLRYASLLGVRGDKRGARRVNLQVQREAWRLLASLEHLPGRDRIALGEVLLDRIDRDRDNASFLWAIGRLGARVPAYGPLTAVVPAETAARWVGRLLDTTAIAAERAGAIVQIGARTDDSLRDIPEDLRRTAASRLMAAGFRAEIEPLQIAQAHASRDALQVFGEALPPGLRLVGERSE